MTISNDPVLQQFFAKRAKLEALQKILRGLSGVLARCPSDIELRAMERSQDPRLRGRAKRWRERWDLDRRTRQEHRSIQLGHGPGVVDCSPKETAEQREVLAATKAADDLRMSQMRAAWKTLDVERSTPAPIWLDAARAVRAMRQRRAVRVHVGAKASGDDDGGDGEPADPPLRNLASAGGSQ